jgi:RHS repeat-associated protein
VCRNCVVSIEGCALIDNNGNTLSDASGRSYTWDFNGRMVSSVVPGTGTVAFKYDPFGRRIYKSSPNFTGIFAYDGFNLIMTMNSGGAVVSRYTFTQNIDEPLAEFRSGGNSYYEADGLGSITSLSSSAGALANTYTYDSFGNVTSSTGTLSNPFRYTGREFDSETGLDFNRARYYDSTAGRFLSEDPIRFFGGVDFYSYVSNSSTNFSDPLGLCPAANNGATISAAPSQPWYKNPCVTSALGSGAVNAGIDAIGLLPEGKAFTGAYSLFHGAAGASNGLNILLRVKAGAGIIGTANSLNEGDGYSTALGVAGFVPGLGQVAAGLSIARDIYKTASAVGQCY